VEITADISGDRRALVDLRKREETLDVGGRCSIDVEDRQRWSTAEIVDIGGSEGV